MLGFQIVNGRGGKKYKAEVDEDFSVFSTIIPRPPITTKTHMRVFRQHLTADGTPSGSSDMGVDGSVTNVDFWVPAHNERDRYICRLDFVIADASANLNEFANTASPLTNGCRLFYIDELGEVDIHDALKTNFDFVRLCGGQPSFGDTTNAFRANNVSGGSEGYIPQLNLRETFGFEWGVKLLGGSIQKLTIKIRDDCTAADQFDCIAYGFERLP